VHPVETVLEVVLGAHLHTDPGRFASSVQEHELRVREVGMVSDWLRLRLIHEVGRISVSSSFLLAGLAVGFQLTHRTVRRRNLLSIESVNLLWTELNVPGGLIAALSTLEFATSRSGTQS
jgi:hypothetical protein